MAKTRSYLALVIIIATIAVVALYNPQPQAGLVFIPSPYTEYLSEKVNPPDAIRPHVLPVWKFSLPKNTVVSAVDSGLMLRSSDPQAFVIQSLGGKWQLVYKSEKLADKLLEVPDDEEAQFVLQGDKLFTVREGDNNFVLYVRKIEGDCLDLQNCSYADPGKYFDSIGLGDGA